jgi:hypothetical protein
MGSAHEIDHPFSDGTVLELSVMKACWCLSDLLSVRSFILIR